MTVRLYILYFIISKWRTSDERAAGARRHLSRPLNIFGDETIHNTKITMLCTITLFIDTNFNGFTNLNNVEETPDVIV